MPQRPTANGKTYNWPELRPRKQLKIDQSHLSEYSQARLHGIKEDERDAR